MAARRTSSTFGLMKATNGKETDHTQTCTFCKPVIANMETIDPFSLYTTVLRKRNLYLCNNVIKSVK